MFSVFPVQPEGSLEVADDRRRQAVQALGKKLSKVSAPDGEKEAVVTGTKSLGRGGGTYGLDHQGGVFGKSKGSPARRNYRDGGDLDCSDAFAERQAACVISGFLCKWL